MASTSALLRVDAGSAVFGVMPCAIKAACRLVSITAELPSCGTSAAVVIGFAGEPCASVTFWEVAQPVINAQNRTADERSRRVMGGIDFKIDEDEIKDVNLLGNSEIRRIG
jgi:hypothetical protein